MLFEIPKSFSKKSLLESLCKFGKIRNFSLKPDMKKNGFLFGQVDFIELDDKKSFYDFLKQNNIKFKEKASKVTGKKTICKEPKDEIHNPSFHFYKSEAYGKDLENFRLENNYEELFKIEGAQTFELTTTYPGLLIGSGYNHPKHKNNDDDYQLGFFFDHTTGLPVISGSSIKGVIRSVFPDKKDDYYEQKIEFLKEEYNIAFDEDWITKLFDNNASTIFYDGYIKSTAQENKSKIFGSDYITSHFSNEKMGAFKNPNPVKFLKILPGVTFVFQFQATEEQVKLFEKIIRGFGIGAKTNVGYGQFVA